MTTSARYRALQWFHDHEALGPDGVFGRKPPTTRMRRLMAKEGEVYRIPVGQFAFGKWLLTPQGREKLDAKPLPRKKGGTNDACERQRTEGSEQPVRPADQRDE
jgi:hypothetical protein